MLLLEIKERANTSHLQVVLTDYRKVPRNRKKPVNQGHERPNKWSNCRHYQNHRMEILERQHKVLQTMEHKQKCQIYYEANKEELNAYRRVKYAKTSTTTEKKKESKAPVQNQSAL